MVLGMVVVKKGSFGVITNKKFGEAGSSLK